MSTIGFAPLISVVTAVFNCKSTLQQCLDSVAQQTYAHIELIVIDGGSTDGTVELIQANAQRIAYWISEPDRGIYNAWNKALAKATGDWICFLGTDDYLLDAQVMLIGFSISPLVNPLLSLYVHYVLVLLIFVTLGTSRRSFGGSNTWRQGKSLVRSRQPL